MADIVTKEKRSEMMAGIKSKDTGPELVLRRLLHSHGFRYRLHVSNLAGKPDLVLSKYNAAIFVHGCFWHGHNCHLFKLPTTRVEFWKEKIAKNVERDQKATLKLSNDGWKILTVWECALRGKERISLEKLTDTTIQWVTKGTHDIEIKGEKLINPGASNAA